MSSISIDELKAIRTAANRIAKKYRVAGICLYGSRIAGYSRADSDFDVIVVLKDYPYAVKYIYTTEAGMKISALVVDLAALEKDAVSAFLGEFVVGRLLHIYESIESKHLFERIEITYKKRVILDEIYNIVKSANLLSTQIIFPLEYIMFSKIRYRSILYPNAAYSYYQTYTGKNSLKNIEFALNGYRKALEEILAEDKDLLVTVRSCPSPSLLPSSASSSWSPQAIQISDRRVEVQRQREIVSLRLTKKLQEFSSYFIHAYAGRHTLRHVVAEAEAKINRHKKSRINLPDIISTPKDLYWKLPEGIILVDDDKDWLNKIAKLNGFSEYMISGRRNLAPNGATILYVLSDCENQNVSKSIVVKKMTRSRRLKWAGLHTLSSVTNRSKVDALFRLGTEYRALRYIRSIGLHSPAVQSVILSKKILVTEFIDGKSMSDILKECLAQNGISMTVNLKWINLTGEHIARVHKHKCTLGRIKPNNLIVSQDRLYFTGVEEFGFNCGDHIQDIIHFISHALKKTKNTLAVRQILEAFFTGYSKEMPQEAIKKMAKSKYYLRLLYTTLNPSVAETIKKEMTNLVS